jgi:hypothetical protein
LSASDDLHDDMARLRSRSPDDPYLDELTAERLVAGAVAPDDVPPAFAPVARVLQAATEPGRMQERQGEDAVLQMFASERGAVGVGPTPTASTWRRPLARRVAVAVAAGSLVFGGGVAAATGHLPDPAQSAAHDAFSSIGVDVPDAPDERPGDDKVGTTAGDRDKPGRNKDTAACTEASDGRCKAGDSRTEDRGSNGGDEPADPGDLGGAPGSVGPPSSTTDDPDDSKDSKDEKDPPATEPEDETGPPGSKPDRPGGPPDSRPGRPEDPPDTKPKKPKKPKDPGDTPGEEPAPDAQAPPSSVP